MHPPRPFIRSALGFVVCAAAAAALSTPAQAASDAELRWVTYVGVLPSAQAPQVFFETSEPVRPKLQRHSDVHYSVHVPAARLSRSVFSLPLDLACLRGPFSRVVAEPQEEPTTGIAVQVYLRGPAALKLERHHLRWTLTAEPLGPQRSHPDAGRRRLHG